MFPGKDIIFFFYRLLTAAAFPFIVIYLFWRGLRDRRYFGNLAERFGLLPRSIEGTGGVSIWLHVVSVGEAMSSIRLVERLRAQYPGAGIYVSSTTLAGRAIASEKLGGMADGVFHAPIDYCFAVRRVLRRLRPSLVVVLETEIWPNLYREAKRSGAGLTIVNGRISDRAMPRYRRLAWAFRPVLALPDVILAQNPAATARFLELGAPADRVRTAGNLKYDFDPGRWGIPGEIAAFLQRTQPAAVWVAASTMPPAHAADIDEDDAVLEAFGRLAAARPKLLLILAPRRPERFDAAAGKLRDRGIRFARRSALRGETELQLPGALLLDSIGELSGLFSLASAAFMGGTIAERGGHNVLEPAFAGCPVVAGPHMENFPDIAEEFQARGGLVRIANAKEIENATALLLDDPAYARRVGETARALAEAKRGATDEALVEARRLLGRSIRRPVRGGLTTAALWPLTLLWRAGAAARRGWTKPKKLETPVISIGGIGMGGSGKTPCALRLAQLLKDQGRRPAILTRGYRRRTGEASTVLAEGSSAPVSITGDEPQLFLRAGAGPVGIGADRYATGVLLEAQFRPDAILLDDGFQHWRLARKVDLVLIDALDPFAGEAAPPLGRLREPLEALGRTDAFVITRAAPGCPLEAIEARLREQNPQAPIFRSRMAPSRWVDLATGETLSAAAVSSLRAVAFCGLANPGSFWQTLGELGCRPMERRSFADHHRYALRDVAALAARAKSAGCEALLTTEKDAMNLPAGAAAAIRPLRLLTLEARMEIEEEERLMDFLRARLQSAALSGSAPS
ncbi:MAG: tetraacyldisaccharide 4'-kinase [Bryobacteraceae bacterium]|nr:tetraacyldisaccharide 4'-kinase [Bryobacteraceae bacterium]